MDLTGARWGLDGAEAILKLRALRSNSDWDQYWRTARTARLQIDAPDVDGRVVLDFNRATNLPCAYTDLATCPLPPAENRLPIAVEAGEKTPYARRSGGLR
jgi:Protein of unknown function (DUF1684)